MLNFCQECKLPNPIKSKKLKETTNNNSRSTFTHNSYKTRQKIENLTNMVQSLPESIFCILLMRST